jgi:glycosyltransferase involved in cell wall biosynthesis
MMFAERTMKIAVILNTLGIGGTEKAACRWARGLHQRGHDVVVWTLVDGPRRRELEDAGVCTRVFGVHPGEWRQALRREAPEVIHVHVPGYPHVGDVLGDALVGLPKIPVVQTNVFGQLRNPREEQWTDFRLFISWTSCVQAVRRIGGKLDGDFFRRASVVVYPVDGVAQPSRDRTLAFRSSLGVREDEVLLGRLSRPDPAKWTNLSVLAFQRAVSANAKQKLLLREPPEQVAVELRRSRWRDHVIILPATTDAEELGVTVAALDVVLHTSSIGESFGYGIAEPMRAGKPVITHSVPWGDQAQLELVRHGETGFVASTPAAMACAIARLGEDGGLREQMGAAGSRYIQRIADPDTTLERLECILRTVASGGDSPYRERDLAEARAAEENLHAQEFGHTVGEWCFLRAKMAMLALRNPC